MFSEETARIVTYDTPIDSEFYGERPHDMHFPKFFRYLIFTSPGMTGQSLIQNKRAPSLSVWN